MEAEEAVQKLYEGAVTDERMHSAPHRYRQRRFGGSTTIWGGRCVPLDAIDFEPVTTCRPPAGPSTSRPCSVLSTRQPDLRGGEFQYSAAQAFDRPLKPMIEGFRSEHFSTDTLERFSCPPISARGMHTSCARRPTCACCCMRT